MRMLYITWFVFFGRGCACRCRCGDQDYQPEQVAHVKIHGSLPLYLNDLLNLGNLLRNLLLAVSSCCCRISFSSTKTTSVILFTSSLTGKQKHRLPLLRYRGGSQVSELPSFSPCLLVKGSFLTNGSCQQTSPLSSQLHSPLTGKQCRERLYEE